jgi:putative aldouronate transport system permease protein
MAKTQDWFPGRRELQPDHFPAGKPVSGHQFQASLPGIANHKRREGLVLFLIALPLLLTTFIFSYLPLAGWSYAFFDYRIGYRLFDTEFVGFKHFLAPFRNAVLRAEILRVMRNTLGMSLIWNATSFLPMIFAIFLSEIRSSKYRRVVQTITTLPNFVSWVLIYALAFAMFSVDDGFVNILLQRLGLSEEGINFLASPRNVWRNMWLYGMWKGLGWNAIIYIASISSIDETLYEAAVVDGAGRFQKMRYITIPSLLPAFFVLLVLNIGNLLNNGFDQFFVFQNAMNKDSIEVLDLFVYNKGIGGSSNNISYTTAVGVLKSVISITLLFLANRLSKIVRNETLF